jgi:hypothetical protein
MPSHVNEYYIKRSGTHAASAVAQRVTPGTVDTAKPLFLVVPAKAGTHADAREGCEIPSRR